MSENCPSYIIVLIVDIVGEKKKTNLLKELALVSQAHSFLQICSELRFTTVELHDAIYMYYYAAHLQRRDSSNYLKEARRFLNCFLNHSSSQLLQRFNIGL